MYTAIPTQSTCARAWVAAASAISDEKEAYNVVIDIQDATAFDADDNAVISLVDRFLKDHHQNPIVTVANTIFPQALYRQFGRPKFYDEYNRAYDALTDSKRWGRYFERMIRHRLLDGTTYSPLEELIEKLRKQRNMKQTYRCAYELAVYDPLLDRRVMYGGQCLSFLSFKLDPVQGLMLLAVYRNHTYITRCLGNLIGLGRLQSFVARECGYEIGPMTCVSTHAELDTGGDKETGKKWGITAARKLVAEAAALLVPDSPGVPTTGKRPVEASS